MKEKGIRCSTISPRQSTKYCLNYHTIEEYCRENCHPSLHCDQVLCQRTSDTSVNSTSSDDTDEYLNSTSISPKKRLAHKYIICGPTSVSHSENNNVQNSIEINCLSTLQPIALFQSVGTNYIVLQYETNACTWCHNTF